MIGGFLSLQQSDGLTTAGFAWTTAASYLGITERKHKGFSLKQTLVQLQVYKGTTDVAINAKSGPEAAVFEGFALSCASKPTSLIWGTSHFALELMQQKASLNKKATIKHASLLATGSGKTIITL